MLASVFWRNALRVPARVIFPLVVLGIVLGRRMTTWDRDRECSLLMIAFNDSDSFEHSAFKSFCCEMHACMEWGQYNCFFA